MAGSYTTDWKQRQDNSADLPVTSGRFDEGSSFGKSYEEMMGVEGRAHEGSQSTPPSKEHM